QAGAVRRRARHAPGGAGGGARSRRRRGAHARAGGPRERGPLSRLQSLVGRAAPRGDRARVGFPAESPPAGRADRGHEPGRGRRRGAAGARGRARGPHRALDRAQRPPGDGALPPGHRAQFRQGDRPRHTGRDRAGPGGDRGLPGRGPVTAPVLEVRDLRVAYGHVEAVRGVSLSVGAGEIVTLIGPNGAGKSSTLNAIAGLVAPASGSVRLEGREVAGAPSHAAVAAGIVLVPEGRAILQRMTVAENLRIGAEARPWPDGKDAARAAIEAQVKRFPSLERRLHLSAGALSGGEQQMLAIARGLLQRPKILLLDEPSMGLAPLLVRQIFDIVKGIHREGTTIL